MLVLWEKGDLWFSIMLSIYVIAQASVGCLFAKKPRCSPFPHLHVEQWEVTGGQLFLESPQGHQIFWPHWELPNIICVQIQKQRLFFQSLSANTTCTFTSFLSLLRKIKSHIQVLWEAGWATTAGRAVFWVQCGIQIILVAELPDHYLINEVTMVLTLGTNSWSP